MTQIERFGKYILLEKIATGGMAEIYLARTPGASGINKYIAIKRILPQYSDNPEFVEMFKSEAKIAINLKHSNIVSIFEFGVEKGQFFLVMDFVEGRNLRQIINRMKQLNKTFGLDQICFMIREAAAGLDSAHRCLDGTSGRPLNITHRDISPQNVMISYEGEVKIVDFGIAKTETQLEATKAGTLKGKFGYMSPEQAEGIQVDLRTDIFSLGIVLWELITNDRLFMANNEMNTLRKIRDCQIPSLRKINPKVPEDLEKIVNKSLAKDRNLRYQTAAAFHRDLNTFLNKNYPSFSQHDFGNLIKSTFSDEIVSIRNKLVEYSKVQVDEAVQLSNTSPNKQEITRTLTFTENPTGSNSILSTSSFSSSSSGSSLNVKPAPSANLEVDGDTARIETVSDAQIDFKQLIDTSLKQKNVTSHEKISTTSKNASSMRLAEQVLNARKKDGTRAGTKTNASLFPKKRLIKIPSLSFLIPGPTVTLTMFLLIGLYFGADNFKNLFSGKTDLLSKPPLPEPTSELKAYRLSITSTPTGAGIFVNGEDRGKTTPGIIDLEPNKTHSITLKYPGFIIYQTSYTADRPADTLKASLQKAVQGFLNIRVFPNNAKIYINLDEVTETPPLTRYAVPANKQLVVRAVDKWTGAEAQEKVIVEENRIKTVELFLNKKEVNK